MQLKDFTRGGQILLHNLHMLSQVMLRMVLVAVAFFMLFAGWRIVVNTTPYERYIAYSYYAAQIQLRINPDSERMFKLPEGEPYLVSTQTLVNNPRVIHTVNEVKTLLWGQLVSALWLVFLFFCVSILVLSYLGRQQRKEQFIRGAQLLKASKLKKKLLKEGQQSSYQLAGMPLVKNSEKYNVLLLGAPGVGKTQAIYGLLDTLRARGQRAIIYDVEGVFTTHYYRASQDIILNPLDARGVHWDVWADATVPMHFDAQAASLIPMPSQVQDPFWITSARIIFAITAQKMQNDPARSHQKLLQYLTSLDADKLPELVKGTEIESMISEKAEKLAISIKAMLANHLSCLKYLPARANAFSIRKWVHDSDDSWLFITSRDDYHATLLPLLTTWLDVTANALLSLSENAERRIWYFADELATLKKMPNFDQLLARGRKRGICVVAGLQTLAQLKESCGVQAAEKLSGMFATRVLFRNSDPDTANWISRALGRSEVSMRTESISYGAHQMRDGVNLSQQRQLKPLVLPEQIMALKDLTAYVRLAGDYPLTKTSFDYQKREIISKSFVERDVSSLFEAEVTPQSEPVAEDESEPTPKLEVKKKPGRPKKESTAKETTLC